jgi:phosphoribosylaminoimidazole-succinocarboxamide synthase
VLVRNARPLVIENIVRGYLAGSGWKEYQASGTVCGLPLPAGLREADRLPQPIFTPSTKAESGHDENIPFATAVSLVGRDVAEKVRDTSIALYEFAAQHALERGIIIADTKFEFGLLDSGELILIDEMFTPDSSRFWPADSYQPGGSPPSFDKQYVRDYLESIEWNKEPPAPALPDDVVAKTREKYEEAMRRLVS